MKAITPVLSLILLIIIVIVVIGFSFGFFGNLISSTTQTAEEQVAEQTKQMETCFFIEAASNDTIYIRNCGPEPLSNFIVATNKTYIPLIGNTTIEPNSVAKLKLNLSSIEEGVHEFIISAGPLSRNIKFYASQQYHETTDLIISDISVNTGKTEANISWTTNKLCSYIIEYSTDQSYANKITNLTYATSHFETISGLSPLTMYYFRINCTDETGNSVVYINSFETKGSCIDDSDCPGLIFDHTECNGSNVYNVYYNYTCQSNECVGKFVNMTFKEHCSFSCFDGECKVPDSLSHSDVYEFPCQDSDLTELKNTFDNIESNLHYYNYDDSSRLSDSAILWLGWSQTDAMQGYAEMYRATHDIYYLKKLVLNADRIISWRNDNYRDEKHPYGLRDYKGDILKTWTFNQSSSEFLQVTYTQTTGTITYPMLDFAKIVYDNPALQDIVLYDGMTMKQKADYYVQISKEAVAEHDLEWQENDNEGYYVIYDPDPIGGDCNQGEPTSCSKWEYYSNFIDKDEGYYVCPENTAPIPYERSCVPINQQSLIMKSIIRLYELTGEQQYWNKMQKYAQFLKNRFEYDQDGNLYLIRHNCDGIEPGLLSGWSDTTRCPHQQAGISSTETINYWGIIVEVAAMLNENNAGITDTDMQRLANTFTRNIYKPGENYLSHIINGAGTDIRAVPGLFRLAKFNHSIYNILKEFYVLGDDNPHAGNPDYFDQGRYYLSSNSLPGYARSILYCSYSITQNLGMTDTNSFCDNGVPSGFCLKDCGININAKYCNNGTIVDNCILCGCDPTYTCKNDGKCYPMDYSIPSVPTKPFLSMKKEAA